MHRRLRLTLIGIGAFVALLIVAAIVATYVMLQPQRFTDLLRAQARKAGLNLALSAPAEPTLWPQPAVVMHGLTLTADNRPVLVAAKVRLVLPWRTLLGGPPAITRLELVAPRINLAQLGPLLGRMQHGKAGPPLLPHIDAGIRITHGSLVRGTQLLLGDIRLKTGRLTPGHVFSMQLAANTAHGHPVTLTLSMTPQVRDNAIRFENIRTTASGPSGLGWVLEGHALWRGGSNLAMTLDGTFTRSHQRHYDTTLVLAPAAAASPFMLHLKLSGPGMGANLHMSPSQLVAWWQKVSAKGATGDIPLPPLTGSISAKKITLGDTTIEGLKLTTDTPAPAPATSSAPAQATSSTVAQATSSAPAHATPSSPARATGRAPAQATPNAPAHPASTGAQP